MVKMMGRKSDELEAKASYHAWARVSIFQEEKMMERATSLPGAVEGSAPVDDDIRAAQNPKGDLGLEREWEAVLSNNYSREQADCPRHSLYSSTGCWGQSAVSLAGSVR